MSNSVVQIGTALKWQGVYSDSKKYYMDNIITMSGCVFRCKVLQTQGRPPATRTEGENRIEFANSDIWDVVLDITPYYNQILETQGYSEETREHLDALKAIVESILKSGGEEKPLVTITTDDGDSIRNGEGRRVLTAHAYLGSTDVTDTLVPEDFSWRRKGGNPESDEIWNNFHIGVGKTITVT